jgi:putative two-component system response regulator
VSDTVLIADDLDANARLFERLLKEQPYRILRARDGAEAVALARAEQPELVLLDVMMPVVDGFEACRLIKQDPLTRLTPIVLVTSLRSVEDRVRGIEAGADDFLSKPVNAHELRARVRSLIRLKRYTDDLESAESVITSLALTVEARDPATEGHCARLAYYAGALGRMLALDAEEISALERGGYLHDVGKIGVPDSVLLKTGPLTPGEYALMKTHTIVGERLCGELRSLRRVREIVRHHHERLDGTGYPDGLSGDAIPFLAQVMSVVDIFDALTTQRPYKPAIADAAAYDELRREAERGWRRADLVEAFIALHVSGAARQG